VSYCEDHENLYIFCNGVKLGHTLERKKMGLFVFENISGACSSAVDTSKNEKNFTGKCIVIFTSFLV
jgi:hypothetical protein